MKYIGPHVSIAGGVFNAPLNASNLGATGFGMFSKNQRQWTAKPYDTQTIDTFKKNMQNCGYTSTMVLVHDSYLINIGNADPSKNNQSLDALIDELHRCSQLGLTLLNMHPGSHLGVISEEECLKLIAVSINKALDATSGVTVVLENTAGQGSNVGYTFEHLAEIIRLVDDKSRIGYCIDTCHAFAAGYDLRTKAGYEQTINKIESIIGLKYLRGFHLNDSKGALNSNLDRHHSLGQGELGLEPFKLLMQDRRFDKIPMVLETIDESLWAKEIQVLNNFAK